MLESLKTLILCGVSIYVVLMLSYIFKKPKAIRLSLLGITIIQALYLTILMKNKCAYFWMSSGTAFLYTLGLNLFLIINPPKGRGFYFMTAANFFVTYITWQQLRSNSASPYSLPPSFIGDGYFYLWQVLVYISITLTLLQIYRVIEGKALQPSQSLEPTDNYRLGKAAAITWLTALIFKMWWAKNMWGKYYDSNPFDNQYLVVLLCQIALLNLAKLHRKMWYWNMILLIFAITLVILFSAPVYEIFMDHHHYAM